MATDHTNFARPRRKKDDPISTFDDFQDQLRIQDDTYPILEFRPNNLSISPAMPQHQHQHQHQNKNKNQNQNQNQELGNSGDDRDIDPLDHRPRRPNVDKNRAPKLAALIFLTFFTLTGFNHVQRHFHPFSKSKSDKNTNSTDDGAIIRKSTFLTDDDDPQIIPLPLPLLLPNLDNYGKAIQLPSELSNLADLTYTSTTSTSNEVPLFWHIPRTGGSTLKDIFSFCLHLTVASEVGGSYANQQQQQQQQQLQVVVDTNTGAKFINVDTTTLPGITHASQLHLSSHPSLSLITTPYLLPATTELFTPYQRARLFTILRHPVERAVSMYHYLAATQPEMLGNGGVTSIEEYVRSTLVENNWMTRFLVGKMGGELYVEDEALAKEILRKKCLVGLLGKRGESFRRFELYFGWDLEGRGGDGGDCVDRLLNWDWSGKNKHDTLEEGSETWDLLKDQNTFDLKLFQYAEKLFEHQGEMFLDAK